MLREAVGELTAKYGHEYFVDQARSGGKASELWGELAGNGFLGVAVPEEYGGGGGGISELAVVCEEVATHGCPLLLILVSAAICVEVLSRFGSEEQKQRWLPGLAQGDKMVFAIT